MTEIKASLPSAYWIQGFEAQFADSDPAEDVEHTIAWYRSLLAPYFRRDRQRVLDLGCGPGRVVRAMASLSANTEFVGVDGSEEIIQAARSELKTAGVAAELVAVDITRRGTVAELGERNGPFDLVTSFFVLHHYPPGVVARVLAELRLVLAPGGVAVLAECNNAADKRAAFADDTCVALAELAGVPPDLLMTPPEILHACRQAGFEGEEVKLVPRRGASFSPKERHANRVLIKRLWDEVLTVEQQYLELGLTLPPQHWRLKEILTAMSRHRVALPPRIGPVLCVIRPRNFVGHRLPLTHASAS